MTDERAGERSPARFFKDVHEALMRMGTIPVGYIRKYFLAQASDCAGCV